MACKKPGALRKMVTESRSISPPLITKEKATSELDILYNRIDQQVELISVLKQRLDDVTNRWERSEAEHETQEVERNKVQMSYNKVSARCSNLELRWNQLSENHKEMIILKDDYKGKCQQLTALLKKYEAGESAALAAEQRKSVEYQRTILQLRGDQKKQAGKENDLQEKIAELEAALKQSRDQNTQLSGERENDKYLHRVSVSQFEIKLDDNDKILEDNRNQHSALTRQIADLTQQILSRGKLVHEKEDQITQLHSDKSRDTAQITKLSSELATLREGINSNRIVRELREELMEEQESLQKVQGELTRFKKVAQERLQREQNLNEELRHVTSKHVT